MKIYQLKLITVLMLILNSLLTIEQTEAYAGNSRLYRGTEDFFHPNLITGERSLPLIATYDEIVLPATGKEFSDIGNTPEAPSTEEVVSVSKPFHISLGPAVLKGEAGSLKYTMNLIINGLTAHELPPLDAGMVNVTGEHAAYRMLPHGAHFAKDVNILLPYDKSLLPLGYTEDDIQTYYYDENYQRWIVLQRDSVDRKNTLVVSRVNHFTDFINAIIRVPEMPEATAYTPTTMKEMKAANPLDGLNLIAPPSANNSGSANVSYPLELPSGRQGMQPDLSVTYNSSGSNGWMGLGWDLSIPMITIDTRWGVPRYDEEKESEIYLFSGEQLARVDENGGYKPLPHREEWETRVTGSVQFYKRVEGDFLKIVRHGSTPRDYWWEVTDKSGMRYFYGKKLGREEMDPAAVLRDARGNIGKWGLTEIRDRHENFVYYAYHTSGLPTEDFYLYPKEITYTGYQTAQGRFKVKFKTENKPVDQRTSSARLGMKEIDHVLLTDVEIYHDDVIFRQYKFCYENGDYDKLLLKNISEVLPECMGRNSQNCGCNSAGIITTHSFDYYTKPQELFGSPVTINTGDDSRRAQGLVSRAIDAPVTSLGGSSSQSWSLGGALTVGAGFGTWVKNLSAGGNYMHSRSKAEGILTIIDMDGDGLPDKVFRDKHQNKLYYRKQLYDPSRGRYYFSNEPYPLEGLGEASFLSEKSKTNDWGIEAHVRVPFVGASGSKNWSKTKSTTHVYFSDVNGDGLPDIVQDGYVYFNRLVDGHPTFEPVTDESVEEEGDCGSGGGGGGGGSSPSTSTGAGIDPDMFQEGTMVVSSYMIKEFIFYDTLYIPAEEEIHPDHDAVRMWIAPYNGYVTIESPVCLTSDLMQNRLHDRVLDGVRVSVQKNDAILDSLTLKPEGDTCLNMIRNNVYIRKGDRLYFRLESRKRRYYDRVDWAPRIIYTRYNNSSVSSTLTDADGKKNFVFDSHDDFLINPKRKYEMPLNGTINVRWNLTMDAAVKNRVDIKIMKDGTAINTFYIPAGSRPTREYLAENIAVSQGDNVWVEVSSTSNVNWSAIKLKARLYYTQISQPGIPVWDESVSPAEPFVKMDLVPFFTDYPMPVLPSYPLYGSTGSYNMVKINLTGTNGSGVYNFVVRNSSGVVTQKEVTLPYNGYITIPGFSFAATGTYYFDLYTQDPNVARNITAATCNFAYNLNSVSTSRPVGVYCAHRDEDLIFGNLYRNWGQFTYRAPESAVNDPIDQSLLQLSEEASRVNVDNYGPYAVDHDQIYDPLQERFLMMDPDIVNNRWVGYSDITYITSNTMGNTPPPPGLDQEDEMDMDVIISPVPAAPPGVRLLAVNKSSETKNDTRNINVQVGVSFGKAKSSGSIRTTSDFMDMNGDQYPDVLSNYQIQYSQPQGGLSSFKNGLGSRDLNLDENSFESETDSYGASFPVAKKTASVGRNNAQVEMEGGAGVSGSFGNNSDEVLYTWIDVNGDGLPDRVFSDGTIHMNLGYMFKTNEYGYFADGIKKGYSETRGFSGSLGAGIEPLNPDQFNLSGTSISGGFGYNKGENGVKVMLLDVNNDGLQDQLLSNGDVIMVKYNTGNGFTDADTLLSENRIFQSESISGNLNAAFTFGFTLGFFPVKFLTNPKTGASWGLNKTTVQFIDMNGDGYPDYVTSDAINEITVRYNQSGKSNLLKSVENIANGRFNLDYTLSLNTYECQSRIWTMTKLDIYDGYTGDGEDYQYFTFSYDSARYDRFDRVFLGFGEVKTFQNDRRGSLYRTVTERFHNKEYMRKGLKHYELLSNSNGIKFIEKYYRFVLKEMATGREIDEENAFCYGAGYPALSEEIIHFYEGHREPQISTRKRYQHGPYGNIVKYYNDGSIDDRNDDLWAEIQYHEDQANIYLVGVPSSIKTYGNNMRHRETVIDYRTGKTERLVLHNRDNISDYQYEYDPYGNVRSVTLSENLAHHRVIYKYDYDNAVFTYPIQISKIYDNEAYISRTEYDIRWGKPIATIDINSNLVRYEYDWRGRLTQVNRPDEGDFSLKFFYWLDRRMPARGTVPWAVTYHYDYMEPQNPLTTTIFTDGLGRVIQTKKDIEFERREASQVSGKAIYDEFGRVVETFNPVVERLSTIQDARREPETPVVYVDRNETLRTLIDYDILDREITVELPDRSVHITKYGINDDGSGYKRFETYKLNPNDHYVILYHNAYGYQTVLQNSEGKTYFYYNPLGELTTVVDPNGISTKYGYDMLGKRIFRYHPATGEDRYEYDAAGNLVRHITQDLANRGEEIHYKYYYDRLTDINYPLNPENTVHYRYGAPGESGNRAGRVVHMEDATGYKQFWYGYAGEIVKEVRTMVLPTEKDAYTFTMEFRYDMWNRTKDITYPDGEKVFYRYDKGGMVKQVYGEKEREAYSYIDLIEYNKFGQKIGVMAGNNVYTGYQYDVLQRLSQLKTETGRGDLLRDVYYRYDGADNITQMWNDASSISNGMGGRYSHDYAYDELNRLIRSRGQWESSAYNLDMDYYPNGNIKYKTQSASMQIDSREMITDYSHEYLYGEPNRVDKIREHRTGREMEFLWDANGNMVRETNIHGEKRLFCWDESNRLMAVTDDRHNSFYNYGADGERTFKVTGQKGSMYVNGYWYNYSTIETPTLYASPYLVATERGYTKHIYMGGERIASKLGGGSLRGIRSPIVDRETALEKHYGLYDQLKRTYERCLETGVDISIDRLRYLFDLEVNHSEERDIFYYHKDHLGSSAWITHSNGEAIQYMHYLPFGENFITQHSHDWSDWTTWYTFSGKERDAETGYSYFGSRYYSPILSIWLSADPQSDKYPGWTQYHYCFNNPVIYTDPDGEFPFITAIIGGVIGAAADLVSQTISIGMDNMSNGKGFFSGWSQKVDWADVAVSGVEGVLIGSGIGIGAQALVKGVAGVVRSGVDYRAGEKVEGGSGSRWSIVGKNKSWKQFGSEMIAEGIGAGIGVGLNAGLRTKGVKYTPGAEAFMNTLTNGIETVWKSGIKSATRGMWEKGMVEQPYDDFVAPEGAYVLPEVPVYGMGSRWVWFWKGKRMNLQRNKRK